MRGALAIVLLGVLGCGRLSFDRLASDAGGGDDGSISAVPAPPVPASICNVTQHPTRVTPAAADLAITTTDEGYTIVWLDTQRQATTQLVRLGTAHQVIAEGELVRVQDTLLGGLSDLGGTLAIASSDGSAQHIRVIDPVTLDDHSSSSELPAITGRDPFTSNTARTTTVLVSALGGDFFLDPVASDGTVGTRVDQLVRRPKHELACADGPGHGHCAWSQDNVTTDQPTHCKVAEISLPPALGVGTSGPEDEANPTDLLSIDCRQPRVVSGPEVDNSVMIVWTTSKLGVEAEYLVRGNRIYQHLADAGAGPKVQFDGTRFWVAWQDPDGVLQLTSFDQTGKTTAYPMPGWLPNGPESFELAQRGAETVLAVVRPGELDVLTVCQPTGV